jgi:peroxidase
MPIQSNLTSRLPNKLIADAATTDAFLPFAPQSSSQAGQSGHLKVQHPGASHRPPDKPPLRLKIEYRTIDGSGNDRTDLATNVAGGDFTRIGPARFADASRTPVDGPNARVISNVVVGNGDPDVANAAGLSAMMYAWGQFLDHDLDLANGDGKTHFDITVAPGDPTFPAGTTIGLTRVVTDPATGAAVNSVTGWLDASMVYGSDLATAASLRTADGRMATSAGNNLPVVNGMFAAGDVRVAENPSLTALQTLFVREHNFQVDQLKAVHPSWTGDQLYNQARAIVAAEIAHITYSEFLPHLLGRGAIGAYKGYDASIDPRITAEFGGAAYRFGHSIVSAAGEKLDNDGNVVGPKEQLKDLFFEPPANFTANGGADGVLRHLGSDLSQELDVKIVNDLRNFLAAPPSFLDLAAINIQRGRDLGLGTLNDTRASLGFTPYTNFSQVTANAQVAADLQTAFGSVNQVDLWTGGLAEDHAAGAFVGQTFQAIIARQFTALRDGDRLYYENQGFDAKTLAQIDATTLSDVMLRDTDTKFIQGDSFVYFERRTSSAVPETPALPQFIIGHAGTDTLVGGAAGDILLAAAGRETMRGGGGSDIFAFNVENSNVTITDFAPKIDKIEFASRDVSDFRKLDIHSAGGSAVISAGGDIITLKGVTPGKLSISDFIFKG